jgi:PAP2 superfamily
MIRITRLALLACAAATAVLGAPAVAQADVIKDWNTIAAAEGGLLRPTAHGQTRGVAMVEGAVYDAVNAIDRGYQPYLLDLDEVGAQPWVSQDAAAATAAYRVLRAITPTTRHAGLDTAYTNTLAGIPDGPIEQGGVAAGGAAAAAMLDFRRDDGFMAAFNPVIGTDSGNWRPIGWPATPAFDPDGWVANEKPFLIEDPSRYRSKGPNDLESKAYARDFNEVKELGALNSTTRTADQTAAAVFWQFGNLWNPLMRDLATRYDLDTADQARLYGMVNLAAADAAIACWTDKYHWQFWRPRAAIREADTDGNPQTVADPNWESLFAAATATTPPLGTPPFPDHPSGHGCVSGAVLTTMAKFFGSDKVELTMVSGRSLNGAPIPPRHFDSFSDVLDEVVEARIWGGIHFRTADVQGAVIGKKVARYIRKHYFKPLRCR